MDDILKTSDFADDDNPFKKFIKEASLTTGAIPIAPLGGTGFKSAKRKKKKKNKGFFSVNPNTGTPRQKSGNILYSGIEDEEHIEEAGKGGPSKKKKRSEDPLKKIQAQKLTPTKKSAHRLPDILYDGGIKFLKGNDPIADREEIDNKIEDSKTLVSAKQRMSIIVGVLREIGYKAGTPSVLQRERQMIFNIRTKALGPERTPQSKWKTDVGYGAGISMHDPPTGWWGIHNWNATLMDRYLHTYIDHIYAKYLQQVRLLYDAHVSDCGVAFCEKKGHYKFLVRGYVTGKWDGTEWTLGSAVEFVAKKMQNAIAAFNAARRGKVRPQTPPEDVDRLKHAQQIEKEHGAWASIDEVPDEDFSATWRQFYGMDESRSPNKNTPLEISKMIEDPDDTSL